jgi:hypothetical protein
VKISSKWKVNVKPIDDLAAFAGSMTQVVQEEAEESFGVIGDDLLDELRYYPAPPPNSTYVRTFELRNGMKVGFSRTSEGAQVEARNDVRHAKPVVGSFAQDVSAAGAFQAAIHRGRWPLVSQTLSFWFEAYTEDFDARFFKRLGGFGTSTVTRRAFTR